MNRSLPTLRRSSFSTENSSAETLDDKLLTTQRSFPNLKLRNKRSALSVDASSKYASDKRNQDFHVLFRSIPEQERLIEDYGCALQKEILLQGRVYISQNHICFNANIFGWITNLVIAFADIEEIEKRSTAIFIPNAILITTAASKHFFASFLSRDQAYDQMIDLWKAPRSTEEDDDDSDDSSLPSLEEAEYTSKQADIQDNQISTSLPVSPLETATQDEFTGQKADSETGVQASLQSNTTQRKETTECNCSKSDLHFPTVVLNHVYPTNIETLYNLLYNSNFMNQFLSEVEKSTEISIGQWTKADDVDDVEYTRESSYIKYLGGSIGPKSTKCYLKEDMLHLDMNDYISQLTVTQTPDVPSGGSFNVKTRTCMFYAGQNQVRVLVTVLVDFTKSSWLKSTIEKASIDGQLNFYKGLNSAIISYLDEKNNQPKKKRHIHKSHRKSLKAAVHLPQPQPKPQTNKDLHYSFTQIAPSQILVVFMAILVAINIYMATKMAHVDKRLSQFHRNQDSHQYNSVWNMLDNGREDDWLVLSKDKLDQQMIELEKMVKRAGRDLHQMTSEVKHQREKMRSQ
ncbi:GRAM domain-containing protein [Sporodiniella umbellata]|nr:GRAM domain-containing protein [Sporodiniella umbellata]